MPPRKRLKFAMVCASNFNRSMEAHRLLKEHKFHVRSYGVGNHVKLPGPSAKEPNKYDFGTPYQYILDDLRRKDEALYTRNGLIQMLERNIKVKAAPEKFQSDLRQQFDVIVCFEERVMFHVVSDLTNRTAPTMLRPVCVINIEVEDSHRESLKVAPITLQLCRQLEAAHAWEESVDQILAEFETQQGRRPMYAICWY